MSLFPTSIFFPFFLLLFSDVFNVFPPPYSGVYRVAFAMDQNISKTKISTGNLNDIIEEENDDEEEEKSGQQNEDDSGGDIPEDIKKEVSSDKVSEEEVSAL